MENRKSIEQERLAVQKEVNRGQQEKLDRSVFKKSQEEKILLWKMKKQYKKK